MKHVYKNHKTGGECRLTFDEDNFDRQFYGKDRKDKLVTIAQNKGASQPITIDGVQYEFPPNAMLCLMVNQTFHSRKLITMKKTAALLFFFSLFTTLQAQTSIKDFVQQTAVAIPAIHPDSTDYTDLEAIGNAIGDARIVMLGEQDHGDAPTYLAKTRLVKYLHEKKGFNVLAVESDDPKACTHLSISKATIARIRANASNSICQAIIITT